MKLDGFICTISHTISGDDDSKCKGTQILEFYYFYGFWFEIRLVFSKWSNFLLRSWGTNLKHCGDDSQNEVPDSDVLVVKTWLDNTNKFVNRTWHSSGSRLYQTWCYIWGRSYTFFQKYLVEYSWILKITRHNWSLENLANCILYPHHLC